MKFVDVLERVAWTFGQTLLGAWLMLQEGGGGWDFLAVKIAGAAAILNAVKCLVLLNYEPQPGSHPALDVVRRVAWTAVMAGAGAWLAMAQDGNAWNASVVLLTLRNAAFGSLVKSVLALNFGRKDSAATLPAAVDPVAVDPA